MHHNPPQKQLRQAWRERSPLTKLIITGLAIALLTLVLLLQPFRFVHADPIASMAAGTGGAVASVDHRATQAGIDILNSGGNAVDAAIATAAVLGVIEPFSCGIGGGDFMVIYLKDDDRIITLDGREQAPASASVNMFQDPNSSTGDLLPWPIRASNGVAVGVPGAVALWADALARYGTLSLAEVLSPAIAIADNGFEVDATFAQQIEANQDRFTAFKSTTELYLPEGSPPEIGTTFKNPDLANTYRIIAAEGINAFYRGDIGRAITTTVQNPPTVDSPPFSVIAGGMTLADLDEYHVVARPPATTTYRGYEVSGMGLPSSGGITVAEVLNLLEPSDLATMSPAQAWHTVIEAERLAFADRGTYLGDPEYVDAPVPGLLSKDYAQTRQTDIGDIAPADAAEFQATPGNPFSYQTDPSPSGSGWAAAVAESTEGLSTTHLTVADGDGNIVSHTLTIESTGGSGIVVPGYGFMLNNELTDFDAIAPHPNSPEPGKRPRSSMAPTIVKAPDGRLIAFGSPGGSSIITTVLGIAVNMMDFGMELNDAITFPRISQRNGGSTWVDQQLNQTDLGMALSELGHPLTPIDEIGAATGIVIHSDGRMLAAAEPKRRGGGSAMVVNDHSR